MARSGSMWAFNVTRTILQVAGYTVLPENIPVDDNEIVANARNAIANPLPGCVYCYKMDGLLIPPEPASRFITTYRDVRDALVSLMRFIHCGFEEALKIAEIMMRVTDHYAQFPPDICIKLRYDDIVNIPVKQVEKISGFLRLSLDNDQIKQIAWQWDRNNVLKMINDITSSVQKDMAAGKVVNNAAAVWNYDGTVRVFDRSTGFQSGHVSMSKGGEWRSIFTPQQKERLSLLAGDWLERYGFEPD